MSEWPTSRLSEVAAIRFSGVDKRTNAGERPIFLCNYLDVYTHDYISAGLSFMEATASEDEINRFRCERADVIITKDSETPDDIGIAALIVEDIKNLICGYHLALLRPRRDLIDSTYLLKQLGTYRTSSYFSQRANGSTRYGLSSATIASLPIPIAPLAQQRRIAEVLSTLDMAIEKAEALIAKLEKIKAGLMSDLFTNGVMSNGCMRPKFAAAPALYKQTPIGPLPLDWDVCVAGDVLVGIEQGWSPDCEGEPATGSDWGVLKTSSIVWSGFLSSENKRLPAFLSPRRDLRVAKDDVLMTRAGPNSRVGVVARVEREAGNLMLSDKMYRVVPNSKISREFLAAVLSSSATQRDLDSFKTGLAESQTNISQAIVRRLRLPIPGEVERQMICERLWANSAAIRLAADSLTKSRTIKLGLMHDLLTGRVRVPERVAA